jgi:hypothetical protein
MPVDSEQVALASNSNEPHAIHAAEAQVAAEWKVGGVILDLYEINCGGSSESAENLASAQTRH